MTPIHIGPAARLFPAPTRHEQMVIEFDSSRISLDRTAPWMAEDRRPAHHSPDFYVRRDRSPAVELDEETQALIVANIAARALKGGAA
ncbi:MAG: hypothetical protein ACK4NW_02125 [Roseinatronobacter sp.]